MSGTILQEFTDAYESAFGPWPGKTGGQFRWKKFLDSIRDVGEIDRLLEFLASEKRNGRLRSKPYTPDCEAALRSIRSTTSGESRTWDRFASACDLCYGSGWMLVRARRAGEVWEQTDSCLRLPEAYSFALECCCSVGEEFAAKRAEMGVKITLLDVRQRAKAYLLEERKTRTEQAQVEVRIDWTKEAEAKTVPAKAPPPVRTEEGPAPAGESKPEPEDEAPMFASDYFVDDKDGPDPASIPF